MDTIGVIIRGEVAEVGRDDYIRAKTLDLREFGYASLTEEEVREQLAKALAGEPVSVVGAFIQEDLAKEDK